MVKKAQLYKRATMATVSSPRWLRARNGSASEAREAGLGVGARSVLTSRKAIAMRAVTPKNGPRQLIPPSSPPTSGPKAMPRPSAAS